MFDCLCFDFDGTLVDSTEAALEALARVGPAFGCAGLDRAAVERLRGLHAREIVQTLGIPAYRVPGFVARMRREMRAGLLATPPVPGWTETLEALAARGLRLGVLSSNASESLAAYLARYPLPHLDFVVGGAALFGKSRALRRLAARERLRPARMLYVGDELRDLEAARAAGTGFVAVGWGYTDPTRLHAAGAGAPLSSPHELLERIESDAFDNEEVRRVGS
ncbi:HAD family hydrolase [Marichromatium gracile]|uniref:Phosphoglycolate phosphatase n=1 Tax=Marichromatium gracile TaxID=1048 RepID=A0A4R4AC06_MARGR|nr:HAD-IA family hydrolase [Marichromatium gracile]MBK1710468.1 haloacid dehalogenase [Marichromatium gracile]TCW36445.1 phosphoglycolate phosphatase [Marichromatium gracile]